MVGPSPTMTALACTARYFGMSKGFFQQLQTDHDLMSRRRQIADQLKAIRPRAA
jgi:plasmid maintenance system antidote protein VapI